MGTINPQIPTSGQPNSSEDLKIISGMGTIRDAINGNLDDDNIAVGADINGNKLLDGSVDTDQLADASVTLAKLATTLKSGNIALGSYQDKDSTATLSTPNTTICSVSSVAPGIYLLVGAGKNTGSPSIAITSGTGSVTSQEFIEVEGGGSNFMYQVQCIAVVLTTATIVYRATATAGNSAAITLFGIASS